MTKPGITPPNRRQDEGEAALTQGQWAELASVALRLGVPSVIALGLVYFLAIILLAKIDAHAAESRTYNERQLRVLQQICVNTSADASARGTCLSWSFDAK